MKINKLVLREIETKLICIGIPTIGLTILLYHLPSLNPLTNFWILVFMLLNLFADLLSVALPTGIVVSLSYPILICSLLLFGPVGAMWVYIPGTLLTHICRKKEPFKIIYNISQIAISTYIAGLFLPAELGQIQLSHDLISIALAGVSFDILNFVLVIKIISIQTGCSFWKNLKASFQEMSTVRPIYYVTGVIMALCFQSQGFLGAVLVIAPVLGAFFQLSAQNELKNQTSKAFTDALTGLCNRHALEDWWQRELTTITSTSKTLSVVMIDIDDFKQVNDTFGHDIGDEVLKLVAEALNNTIRRSDCIFRYGGEEFIVVLPESDTDGSFQVAERIRSAISNTTLPDYDVHITVSVGLSNLTNRLLEEEQTENIPNELIRRADNAMYVAKQSGKNQIQVYS